MAKAIYLKDIPGYHAALADARISEFRQREDCWLGLSATIAGQPVRVMTVRDYVALLRLKSPFVTRQEPTFEDLGTFLRILSPEIDRWHDHAGWRKPWLVGCRWSLFRIEDWQIWRQAKRFRRRLGIRQLEDAAKAWNRANPGAVYELPDDCPLAQAFTAAFAYIDQVFLDRPEGIAKDGTGSGLLYLTSWFDAMQSEYSFSDDQVWRMKMPVLFNRLKAIHRRLNPTQPEANRRQDRVRRRILSAASAGMSLDDLAAGKLDLSKN